MKNKDFKCNHPTNLGHTLPENCAEYILQQIRNVACMAYYSELGMISATHNLEDLVEELKRLEFKPPFSLDTPKLGAQ